MSWSIRLPAVMRRQVDAAARRARTTRSQLVSDAFEQFLVDYKAGVVDVPKAPYFAAVTVHLPDGMLADMDRVAAASDSKLSIVARYAVERYLWETFGLDV